MLKQISLVVVASLASLSFLQSVGQAAESNNSATFVTIQGEMCGGCVKKLHGALAKLSGVARVDGNIAFKTITIMPAAEVSLSPKKIWQAVESAGKKPAKLIGPTGEFLAKPST